MGGTVPSGYPSSFIMGLVDDDYQDALNSYGLGANAEVNTVSQYMVPTGGSNWDAVYRYLQGGLACTGTGWYAQYPGSGGALPNFANLANGAGYQPIFIYYQIGAVYTSSMTNATFMGEYFQDWIQALTQMNTWMTAHPGKIITVDIEPDLAGTVQQGGNSATSFAVDVASAAVPSCSTPWISLAGFANNFAGYSQAMLYLKDQVVSAGNRANLKMAFHVSGWAVSPNPATTSGMSAGSLSTQASSVAAFLNACKSTSGSNWDLFFTDPSGYDGGYQSAYNWDTGGAMALQYANWLNDLTTDVSLRAMLWQMPEGNSKMNNVLGHYTDTRSEYFLNDSPLNTAGYSHNICLYVASGCIGALWGPGDYHGTDVMDFFYPANYAGSTSQQDGSGNSGAGSWTGTPVVDDDGGFFRTHIANNHTWGATCPLNGGSNTNTPTVTNTDTKTPTLTATATITQTFTDTITKTFSPTFTLTATNTFTKTQTLTFTNTPAVSTSTFTNTPVDTSTATNTFTKTPTYTMTNTPAGLTSTFTNTPAVTSTATLTFTNTVADTATPTRTFSVTPTMTETYTGTVAPANTSTFTHTATEMATATATNTVTNTVTSTVTNTITNTFTPGGNTATITNTPTVTDTQTLTSTPTYTFSSTVTSIPTNTFSATLTATLTSTETPQPTSTFSSTATNTFSPTATPTATMTFTASATFTLTDSPTITQTPTITWTPTVTFTPTPTVPTRVIYSPPYPNPVTNGPVQFDLITPPGSHTIQLDVFTTSFRKVVDHTIKFTGVTTTIQWDLKDRMGVAVSDGLYYVRITVTGTGNSMKILKVMILK